MKTSLAPHFSNKCVWVGLKMAVARNPDYMPRLEDAALEAVSWLVPI